LCFAVDLTQFLALLLKSFIVLFIYCVPIFCGVDAAYNFFFEFIFTHSCTSILGLESQFASSLPTGRLTLFSASVRSRFSACSFTMSFDALMSASVFFRLSSRSLWIVSACASMRLVHCPLHFVLLVIM